MSSSDDEYAQKYMGGEGAIATSRMRMGRLLFLIMGFAALAATVAALATGQLALLLLLPLYAFITLSLSHVRVTVTRDTLHIQYGLFGPKIALDKIEAARAVPYDWKRYGGWGLRMGRDGSVAYSVTGGRKMGLEVDVRDAKGALRTIFVSSDTPEELLRAIEQARGRSFSSGTPTVRVDASAEGAEGAELPDDRAARGASQTDKRSSG